jgi:uncharacterized RDD family membrane protein YckC
MDGSPPLPPAPDAPLPGRLPSPPVPGTYGSSYATFWQRVGARLLDVLIFLPLGVIAVIVLDASMQEYIDQGGGVTGISPFRGRFLGVWLVTTALGAAYEILLTSYKGQTLGKMAVGIRVVRKGDGTIPDLGASSLRWLVYNGIGLIPFVGGIASLINVLSMLWDADRQCWHDKAAGTVVVRTPGR